MNDRKTSDATRRNFLQSSTLAVAGAATALGTTPVHSQTSAKGAKIKIGLIGCGGRGTGALLDVLGAATRSIYPAKGYHTEDVAAGAAVENKDIEVRALADLFDDRLERCRRNLRRLELAVPEERCYTGFDAYEQLLADPEINYVILATPPHFRPAQLMATIKAGKNVFMEKPAAVDVPGVRTVMAAGELAKQKGLGIAAGTQRRHEPHYRETIRQIHDGALGDLQYAKCYWNGGQVWVVDREPGWSDVEYQVRNWNHFRWLSGDHITEQHVHNLDVINWALGGHPISAVSGLGGRQVRTGRSHGNVNDHFAVEYQYPGGVTMFSQSRQINGCKGTVGEFVAGDKGTSNCSSAYQLKSGKNWKYNGPITSGYQLEHKNLIASILAGEPINEAQAIAEATMTAIIGREAVYSGREVKWDDALKSEMRLGPETYALGDYQEGPVAMPGSYRFS